MNTDPLRPLVLTLALLLSVAPAASQTAPAPSDVAAPILSYAMEWVATASFGVVMNDAGTVVGTSYPDPGCGHSCLPPLETVVWTRGVRRLLPGVPGSTGITVTGINNRGWIVGHSGSPGHAVVWKPLTAASGVIIGYQPLEIGTLPGKPLSAATGIDDLGRVVGWSTTSTFPPNGAPFLWTEAGGMVDLSTQGFPNEAPLGISPGGTVATYGFWYRLGDPTSVAAVAPAPSGFAVENSRVAINDAGDQARFLLTNVHPYLAYLFRYHRTGVWQQLSSIPSGSSAGRNMGSITAAGDVTATVLGTGVVAYGPTGTVQSLAALVASAYGGGAVTMAGPMNARGEILARMLVGQSSRLVRLLPAAPCTTGCIRVTDLQMKGHGSAYCDQGQHEVETTLMVADESGHALAGVRVTGHFLDDYWLDDVVVGDTNPRGQVSFSHVGLPCVGAVAFVVTDATVPLATVSKPVRTFDRAAGVLVNHVIPLTRGSLPPDAAAHVRPGALEYRLEDAVPNPAAVRTTLRFSVPEAVEVHVRVYDVLGREVARPVQAPVAAGRHSVEVEVSGLASGVYLVRLTAGPGVTQTRRLTIAR